jgi:hypothetical protein
VIAQKHKMLLGMENPVASEASTLNELREWPVQRHGRNFLWRDTLELLGYLGINPSIEIQQEDDKEEHATGRALRLLYNTANRPSNAHGFHYKYTYRASSVNIGRNSLASRESHGHGRCGQQRAQRHC